MEVNNFFKGTIRSGILMLSVLSTANAALIANLSFTEPRGVVSPTDSIEMWVTLSLDPSSDPLEYDVSQGLFRGIPASYIPTEGSVYDFDTGSIDFYPFESYTGIYLSATYSCSGTFTEGCLAGEYRYNFNNTLNESLNIRDTLFMSPGESRDFLYATFTPNSAEVALGEYTYYRAAFGILVEGVNSNGDTMSAGVTIAETCSTGDFSCEGFSRTVSAVPIPAAVWLFSAGLISLFGLSRNKIIKIT